MTGGSESPPVSPLATASPENQERLDRLEEESRQRFWWWTLLGVLALVLVETWLAGRPTRAPAPL